MPQTPEQRARLAELQRRRDAGLLSPEALVQLREVEARYSSEPQSDAPQQTLASGAATGAFYATEPLARGLRETADRGGVGGMFAGMLAEPVDLMRETVLRPPNAPPGEIYGSPAANARQGVIFGFGDDLTGAVAAGPGRMLRERIYGQPIEGAGRDAAQSARAGIDRARDERPVTSYGLEAAGGLAPFALGLGPFSMIDDFARGTTTAGRIVRGGVVGGPLGAIYGAGENDENRGMGAVVGGIAGTILGAGGPALVEAGGSLLSRAAPSMQRAGQAIVRGLRGNRAGRATVSDLASQAGVPAEVLSRAMVRQAEGQARNMTNAQRRAWARVRQTFRERGLTDDQVADLVTQWNTSGAGEDFVFELNPDLVGLAGQRVADPTDVAAQEGLELVAQRQSGARGRVQDAARQGLGDDGTGFMAAREGAEQAIRESDGPAYRAFRSEPARPGVEVARLLRGSEDIADQTERVVRTLRARDQITPAQARALREAASGDTSMLEMVDIPPAVIEQYRREVASVARRANRAGDNAETGRYMLSEERLRNYLTETFPDTFPQAIESSAALRGQADMLEAGRDLLRGTENRRMPEITAQRVARMTPEERRMFRLGVARAVYEQAQGVNTGGTQTQQGFVRIGTPGNPVSRFFRTGEQMDIIRAAFGDEAKFSQFANRMAREYQRADNFNTINLTPDNRQEAAIAANQVGNMVSGAAEAASGSPAGPLRVLVNLANAGRDRDFNAALSRILFSAPEEIRPLLEREMRAAVAQNVTTDAGRRVSSAIASQGGVQGARAADAIMGGPIRN